MKWYLDVLKKYAVFEGRARRKEFWMFVLFQTIFLIIASVLDTAIGITFKPNGINLGYGFIYLVYSLATFLPNLAVTIRRLHDVNKSGYVILFYPLFILSLVLHVLIDPLNKNPAITIFFVGAFCPMVWLFILFCKKGITGENEYGSDPKDPEYNSKLNSNLMNPTKPDYQNSNQNDGTIPHGGGFENYDINKKKTLIGEQEEIIQAENPKSKYVLAGFLVSFSKTDIGEFWELREGNNAVGSSPDNDIQLLEEHVSGKHANINVSKDIQNNKWKFQLVDLSSSNGTELNGVKQAIYTGVELNNFDKIKVGEYQFMLFAADKFTHELNKNEKFLPNQQPLDYDSMKYKSGND